MSALMYAFLWADEGPALTVTLALLGTVLFSVNSIMIAAAMDAVRGGTEGSAVAMLFTGSAVVGAVSPVIAGWVNGNWGFSGVILYGPPSPPSPPSLPPSPRWRARKPRAHLAAGPPRR